MAVKVKALEGSRTEEGYQAAQTWGIYYEIRPEPGGKFYLLFDDQNSSGHLGVLGSESEAQEVSQAHFTRRILSSIEQE